MCIVGGIAVSGHSGVLMRHRATIGHSWSGRHMASDGRSVGNQWGSVDSGRSMDSGCTFVNDCVEAIVIVGGVLHGAHGTIRLHQRVRALDNITITHLMLRLHITGMGVSDTIVVVILGIGLPSDEKEKQDLVSTLRQLALNGSITDPPATQLQLQLLQSTYMIIQTLIRMSMASIAQSRSGGIETGAAMEDTGGCNANDSQADQRLSQKWNTIIIMQTLDTMLLARTHFEESHFKDFRVGGFCWVVRDACVRYVELDSTDN